MSFDDTYILNKKGFLILLNDVKEKLKESDVDFFIPHYYREQSEFENLTVIIKGKINEDIIRKIFTHKKDNYKKKGSTTVVLYKKFKLIFINIIPKNFSFATDYYRWYDFSMLIGKIFEEMCLTYTHYGLKYKRTVKIYGKNKTVGEIFLTKNFKTILNFLDLDFKQLKNGFDNKQQLFDYIHNSKFFNPDYFYVKTKKGKKNKLYSELLFYLFKNDIKRSYLDLKKLGRDYINLYIDKFFPEKNFFNTLLELEKRENKIVENGYKFNERLVQNIIAIKDDELESFIEYFQKFISKSYYYDDFEKYIENNTDVLIRRDLFICFDEYLNNNK